MNASGREVHLREVGPRDGLQSCKSRRMVQLALPNEMLLGSIARAGLPKGWRPASVMHRAAA